MSIDRHLLSRAVPVALLGCVVLAAPAIATNAKTKRVSVSLAGAAGNDQSLSPVISADGRYVAFRSDASDLVEGDTNGTYDIFVRDRVTHMTERVSIDSAGVQGNQGSTAPSISADGRYVAFESKASDLVGNDTNGLFDVFVHDRATHTTRRVSRSSAGIQGDSYSYAASISADGRFVAFSSDATNLVEGDTNETYDIFVRDRQTHTTRRVSISSAGVEGDRDSFIPAISADGRTVAFTSRARNLVGDDTNGSYDVFVHDRMAGVTERVSKSSAEAQGNVDSYFPSISADGRYVAFQSEAGNLVGNDRNGSYDVFVRDRTTNTTRRVSLSSAGVEGDGSTTGPSISADGRYVAFNSGATNLIGRDTNDAYDVFVRDRTTHTTRRVSLGAAGAQGNSDSFQPSISADGRYVAFSSDATNLVGSDTNDQADVFRRGPLH